MLMLDLRNIWAMELYDGINILDRSYIELLHSDNLSVIGSSLHFISLDPVKILNTFLDIRGYTLRIRRLSGTFHYSVSPAPIAIQINLQIFPEMCFQLNMFMSASSEGRMINM